MVLCVKKCIRCLVFLFAVVFVCNAETGVFGVGRGGGKRKKKKDDDRIGAYSGPSSLEVDFPSLSELASTTHKTESKLLDSQGKPCQPKRGVYVRIDNAEPGVHEAATVVDVVEPVKSDNGQPGQTLVGNKQVLTLEGDGEMTQHASFEPSDMVNKGTNQVHNDDVITSNEANATHVSGVLLMIMFGVTM